MPNHMQKIEFIHSWVHFYDIVANVLFTIILDMPDYTHLKSNSLVPNHIKKFNFIFNLFARYCSLKNPAFWLV